MSLMMQNIIAITALTILIILSWLLAANYHHRRSDPKDYDSELVKENTATLSNKSLSDPIDEKIEENNPTQDSPSVVDQTTTFVAKSDETAENIEQTPTFKEKKEDSTSRLNIFTIIVLLLLIVGTFFKLNNRNN